MTDLGPAGLVSSVLGLGTAAFSGLYGPVSSRESSRVIDIALDRGITMLDTADFFARGGTERLVGKAVVGRRDRVLIATHGGARAADQGLPTAINGHPGYLAAACDKSLHRLGTDYIDLYYLSRVDPRVPVEESVGALAGLVKAGKVRCIGLCEATADELRRAHAVHPVSALAVEYSLRHRAAENEMLPAAAHLGVGVVAYCPLARGLLAGAALTPAADEQHGLRVVAAEAAELDIGMARLALAWLIATRQVIPVPSSRSPTHLEMDSTAARIRFPLGTEARLDGLFPPRPARLR